MKMEVFDRLNLYQNYRQRYTVIPITTVRGPCAKNQIFSFEMVAVVLCFAVDSYFIYSVLEIDFGKLIKS